MRFPKFQDCYFHGGHDKRRTVATNMAYWDIPLSTIMYQLRWQHQIDNISTVARYIKKSDELKAERSLFRNKHPTKRWPKE